MQYRRLGRSGLQVSVLSLGSWVTYHNQVDTHAARELMAVARDAGVNFFDKSKAKAWAILISRFLLRYLPERKH